MVCWRVTHRRTIVVFSMATTRGFEECHVVSRETIFDLIPKERRATRAIGPYGGKCGRATPGSDGRISTARSSPWDAASGSQPVLARRFWRNPGAGRPLSRT